jgi:hypothetical protein
MNEDGSYLYEDELSNDQSHFAMFEIIAEPLIRFVF